MKSVFLQKQGDTPKNRILDFLIVHQEFDYSLKDIAKFSSVGYTTLKKMQKELISHGWIKFTRMVGKAKMYKLNLENLSVQKFVDFYWSVVESNIDIEEKTTTLNSPGQVSAPLSAQYL